jgi:hypothetical protein
VQHHETESNFISDIINCIAADYDREIGVLQQIEEREEDRAQRTLPEHREESLYYTALRRSQRKSQQPSRFTVDPPRAAKYQPVTDACHTRHSSHFGLGCGAVDAHHLPDYYNSLHPVDIYIAVFVYIFYHYSVPSRYENTAHFAKRHYCHRKQQDRQLIRSVVPKAKWCERCNRDTRILTNARLQSSLFCTLKTQPRKRPARN